MEEYASVGGPSLPKTRKQVVLGGFSVKAWVKVEDIDGLAALLESQEPCPHVCLSISSEMSFKRSFIGQEALFMIEGYRKGRYPPELHSHDFYVKKKEEVIAWLNERLRKPADNSNP
jgi:hypothetical protein